ncbi:hypothetical protein LHP98_14130 [Rhodobacter sp. Har01]|uniref:hypothetical protein n=1 Tax=Rhodobacter sp. Har01 TaxID=2883999 RepID=UPI001D069B6E|nr:hypothetical protein [Rhodobacter sp. Har01]MCB6179260.1 hypothetical protein [Rhodobacter sp. Har01]
MGEPTYYRSLYFLEPLEAPTATCIPLAGSVDPFDPKLAEATLQPACGVLTVHEQTWTQQGLQLGNLLRSICLAPGEVIQIAVTDWERRTGGKSSAGTTQSETADSSIQQDRNVKEAQDAVAREAQSGGSSASSSAVTNQAGVSGGWLFFGASGASSSTQASALTAQYSTGSRSLAADSTVAITQSTAEQTHSLRSRYQTVIKEVTEKEKETLNTRVLVNYNRRHALNMLFFEVLQTYEVKTSLKYWDRCLFIPMVPVHFLPPPRTEQQRDDVLVAPPDTLFRHSAQLMEIFAELKRPDLMAQFEAILRKVIDHDSSADVRLPPAPREMLLQKRLDQLNRLKAYCAELMGTGGPVEMGSQEALALRRQLGLGDTPISFDPAGNYPAFGLVDDIDSDIQRVGNELAALASTRQLSDLIGLSVMLEQNRLFVSQQLWLRMSPDQICRLLQKYAVDGIPLVAQVDPHPVGVFGNYLAFRWRFPKGEAGRQQRAVWAKDHLGLDQPDNEYAGKSIHVGLPGSGVFAEAVLGQSLAAEEVNPIYPSWADAENRIPILPPQIAPLATFDRAKGMDLETSDFTAALAQLRAEKIADASFIDKAIGGATRGDSFRDMGGLSEMMKLADKVAGLSSDGAKHAADKALDVQKSVQETFLKMLDSDVGKALVAEYMIPGAGSSILGAKPPGAGKKDALEPQKTVGPPSPKATSGDQKAVKADKPAN